MRKAILCLTTAVAALAIPKVAFAQATSPQTGTSTLTPSSAPQTAVPQTSPAEGTASTTDPSTPPTGLEDIIVTAQRRSENLQRAGLAISAVTGDGLARAGIVSASGLTNVVPSLQVQAGAGPYNLFYLRGVGSFTVNALSDSAVSFNVDGIAISRPSATSGVFYDLDRVEVLKGPQGTLYGRNATGGAINVITRAPKLNEFSGELSGEYGNYNDVKFSGALNVPLGEKAAMRAAFSTNDHDGYLSDGTDDQKDRAGRLRFTLEATPDLTIQLGADYFHQGGHGLGAVIVRDNFVNDRVGNTDPRAQAVYRSTLYFPAGSFLPALPNNTRNNNDFWGVNGSIEWRTQLGTLTVLPAFRRNTLDYGTSAPGLYQAERSVSEQHSIEARFASSNDHPLRWLVGGYFLDDDTKSRIFYGNQFNAAYQNYTAPLQSVAAFGRLTYAITDKFRLTGGARYTRDRKSFDLNGVSANILCFGALIGGNSLACQGTPGFPNDGIVPAAAQTALATGFPIPYGTSGAVVTANTLGYRGTKTFEQVTWRASAEWDVAERSLLYASVETGFKAGGFYAGNINPVYQPEKITAYTIGSKNRFLDNHFQINVEGFYWKYKNQQISHISQDVNQLVVFATENIGNATIKGVEGEILYSPTNSTVLAVNAQYLDAEYKRFQYFVPNLGAAPTTTCPVTAVGAQFSVDCSGRTALQSPKWTINLSAQQTVKLGSTGDLVVSAATKYQTGVFLGLEYLDTERQEGFWLSNAQVTYNPPGRHWSITGFVDNIENNNVKTTTFPHPLVGAALVSATLRPPRTYGVRAGIRF